MPSTQRAEPQQRESRRARLVAGNALRTARGGVRHRVAPRRATRSAPPSGKMFSAHVRRRRATRLEPPSCHREEVAGVGAELRLGQERAPSRSGDEVRDRAPAGASIASSRAAIGEVPLEVPGVDLEDAASPRAPSLNRIQSCPGAAPAPRLPAAPHVVRAPGRSRLFIGPKNASEHASSEPSVPQRRRGRRGRSPRGAGSRRRARGASPARRDPPEGSKAATPPSGKMLSRRWLTGPRARAAKRFCASDAVAPAREPTLQARQQEPPTGVLGVGRPQPVYRREGRAVAHEVIACRCRSPSTRPAAPERQDAPVVRARRRDRACAGSPSRPSTCRGR